MFKGRRKQHREESGGVEHLFRDQESALLGRLHYLQLQLEQVGQLEGTYDGHVEITAGDIQPVGRMTMVMGAVPGAPSTDSMRAMTYFFLGAVASGLAVYSLMRILS